MSIDETPAERAYARQERDLGAWAGGVMTGLTKWAEGMSPTGRRQAAAVAESELRQWVNGTRLGRPSRGEIKAWVTMLVELVRDLHNRLNAATLAAQDAAGLRRELEAVAAQRDDALEDLVAERRAHDADVARLRERVRMADEDRTRRTRERDQALDRIAQLEEDYRATNVAWQQAEAELRAERKGRGVGRASCSHPAQGGAE
jgi:chromosome segregation ATPase